MENAHGAWLEETFCENEEALLTALKELGSKSKDAQQRWLYRGQARAGWGLQPTIERFLPKLLREVEGKMLWDFKRNAKSLSDRLPDENDVPSWLSLMRHHGAPTRLLDWTDSAYVSLFFACGDRDEKDEPNAAIWAVNASLLSSKLSEVAHQIIPALLRGFAGDPIPLDMSSAEHFTAMAWYAFDPGSVGDVGKVAAVAEVMPRTCNFRMSFQQGTFLINCNHQMQFQDSLRAMMDEAAEPTPIKTWARKFTFPYSLRNQILRWLYEHNVHPFTLFPDLDGLGHLLRIKTNWY